MILVCVGLIVIGVASSATGATKAIKSKFKDLNAINWCFAGLSICIVAGTLARFL